MPESDLFTHKIIAAAIAVSKALGPGLLESVYHKCLAYELLKRGFTAECERSYPVIYDNLRIELAFKPDIVVDNRLIIEVKTVSELAPVHRAQILTYMRLSGVPKGLLINFHAYPFAKGIKRFVM